MTSILYAARPFRPGPAHLRNWNRFGLRWVGWNGAEFNLRDIRGGTIVTNEGLLALHFPPFEVHASESPATAGRRRLDARTRERAVKLPVYLWSDDGSPEWALLYKRFFDSFHPTRPGRLEIVTPLGARTLRECYLDSSGDFQFTNDAIYDGHMRCDVNMTAEDPHWYGAAIERDWQIVDPVPFFNASNLWVSEGASYAEAVLTNPGNVSAWPTWTVRAGTAPLVADITVDGGRMLTPSVPAGSTLVIDTEKQVALLDGVDVTDEVDPWDPAPIPDGDNVPLTLILTGLGTVTARIEPRYFRWL